MKRSIKVAFLAGALLATVTGGVVQAQHLQKGSTPKPPAATITVKVTRAMDWPAPIDKLTPGKVGACTTVRNVTQATRDQVDKAYGYKGPHGLAYLEYDHRIPKFACGDDGPANIWPEISDGVAQGGFVHNRKDELEDVLARQMHSGVLSIVQVRAVFAGDWRRGWCTYVHKAGVQC